MVSWLVCRWCVTSLHVSCAGLKHAWALGTRLGAGVKGKGKKKWRESEAEGSTGAITMLSLTLALRHAGFRERT